MRPASGLTVSPGTSEHFAEADRLRERVEWGPGSWFFGPVLAATGVFPLVRDADGTLVGMGLGAGFGRGGFIGNMVVDPAHQRRGIGSLVFEHLLEWFAANGVRSIQLEATPEGQTLYERYGFVGRWVSVTGVLQSVPEAGAHPALHPVEPGDWQAIAALAEAAYGEDRTAFLHALSADPGTLETLVMRENQAVTALGFRREGRVGPVIAADRESAAVLARPLLHRAGQGARVPVGHPMHTSFWTELGVEVEPYDLRMHKGEEPGDHPANLFAMLNGGVG